MVGEDWNTKQQKGAARRNEHVASERNNKKKGGVRGYKVRTASVRKTQVGGRGQVPSRPAERGPVLTERARQCCQHVCSARLVSRFCAIAIRTPAGSFPDMDKLILSFMVPEIRVYEV